MTRSETPAPQTAPLATGVFRETPGYASWRPRGTGDYLLILTRDGAGRFGHAGGELVVHAGDLVLLRPGTSHDYGTARGASGWSLLWAHFLPRPHWREWLNGWPEAAPGVLHLALGDHAEVRARTETHLSEMHRLATGGLPRREQFALNALEAALLWCDTLVSPHPRNGSRFDGRILRAMEHLLEHLSEPVPLPDLARTVGLSPSRFGQLFKVQTGQTPQQWVENERIARAKTLLARTSRAIGAIAAEVGFENPFYFSLRFKKQTGLSPRDFRRQEAGRD